MASALGRTSGMKFLAGESGHNAHDQNVIDIFEGSDSFDRRGGVERDADGCSQVAELLNGLGEIFDDFAVKRQASAPRRGTRGHNARVQ